MQNYDISACAGRSAACVFCFLVAIDRNTRDRHLGCTAELVAAGTASASVVFELSVDLRASRVLLLPH